MAQYSLFLLMLLGGVAIAVQPSVNARLAQKIGFLESACISFTVGALFLFCLTFFWGQGNFKGILQASWWELSGGLCGVIFVSLSILIVPRIGTAAALAAVIAAQLTTGLLLDQFGFFGFETAPMTLKRLAGACLLFLGAFLIFKR